MHDVLQLYMTAAAAGMTDWVGLLHSVHQYGKQVWLISTAELGM